MKFYLYRKQLGQGCDYTIGCGEALHELKAQSTEEAVKEAVAAFTNEELSLGGDTEYSEVFIMTAEADIGLAVALLAKDRAAIREKARIEEEKKRLKRRLAELED